MQKVVTGKHIVALSGGKDSTALALRLSEINPDVEYTYICTPTGDELPEMLEHWRTIEDLLGKKIVYLKAKLDLDGLINKFGALPNFRQRWCTRILKIEPAKAYYLQNPGSIVYVGLRSDEESRIGGIFGDLVNQSYPFREWGWGINEVTQYLKGRNIKIPRRTDCARCYHQRLPEWWVLWKEHEDIFESAISQEKKTGHSFRTPGRDSFPSKLVDMREEFRKGKTPRNLKKYLESKSHCRACSL